MRIAIAGQTYLPGNNGQAIFTIHLAEGLARSGHEVHVITGGEKLQYRPQIINGVHVHFLPSIGFTWLHPGAFLTILPEWFARRIFERYPPDVIHIQDHYFLGRGVAVVGRERNIPMIGTNHFLPENLLPYLSPLPLPKELKTHILWDLMLWTYNSMQLVTTPTETAAKILSRQKIRFPVIPISCGVDIQLFHPGETDEREIICSEFGIDPQKTIFLYVGRHDKEKRIDLLLKGLALLHDRGFTNLLLVLAGQGAARPELEKLADKLGVKNQVRFLGYVPGEKLPRLFRAADIFCMPSPEELQSIATLEAMASGKPILAANARALPELVTPWVNGVLFEPGKAESVAEEMAALVKNRASWQSMGQASRSRAAMHSLERTISRYEGIYQKLSDHYRQAAPAAEMHLRPAGRN